MNRTNLTLVISLIVLAALATTPVAVMEDAFANALEGIPVVNLVEQRLLAIHVYHQNPRLTPISLRKNRLNRAQKNSRGIWTNYSYIDYMVKIIRKKYA